MCDSTLTGPPNPNPVSNDANDSERPAGHESDSDCL